MYPVGTNVLNERTIAESARGLADYVTARKGADRPAFVRHRPRHPAQLARVRRALRAGAGGRRVQGLPLRRAPLDPPALLRRPAPDVRRRHHDHRLAQPAVGQRLQVLRGDRRPGHPARRRGHHRVRQGRLRPRDPREAASSEGWPTARSSASAPSWTRRYIAAVVSESVSHARDLSIVYTPMHGVGETSVAAALDAAGFAEVNILASQRTPDGDFPNVPGHVANPEIPRTLDAADRRGPRRRAPTSSWPATPTPTGSASPSPSPATPRANGRRSTATRSASCWRPS